jgi:AP-3 complex subunit beta
VKLPPRTRAKIKRRVVRKAFYSDEEDESSVESVFVSDDNADNADDVPAALSVAKDAVFVDSDEDLDKDHQLLLRSSLPLLRSRNAGVVMAVAQLHFYVGVSTIEARQSIGKAMVRICRDRREIQYVVLQSIKYLVVPAPSAFSPFINEFFVRATDPSFARLAKLDILTSLALNHQSCDAVLREFRTYVRHNDRSFVLATIAAIGRVANQFRAKSFNGENVGLNCLRGLLALIGASRHADVVGGAVVEVRRILQAVKLSGLDLGEETEEQEDAVRRVVLLLLSALGGEEGGEGINDKYLELYDVGRSLPSEAVASLVWIVGEFSVGWASDFDKIMGGRGRDVNNEIARLAAARFQGLDPGVKLQVLHLGSKLLLKCPDSGGDLSDVCEYILDLGACDVDHDVRDRARFERGVLAARVGWKRGEGGGDGAAAAVAEGELLGGGGGGGETTAKGQGFKISRADALRILAEKKSVPSLVPIKAEDVNQFR